MRFIVVGDYNSESGLDEIFKGLSELNFRKYFAERSYDNSGLELGVVLMCRNPSLNFKQRIRFSKKDNVLYMDIMFDLFELKAVDAKTRKEIVAVKLVNEIPQIFAKYKFTNFNIEGFSSDLSNWFRQEGWFSE